MFAFSKERGAETRGLSEPRNVIMNIRSIHLTRIHHGVLYQKPSFVGRVAIYKEGRQWILTSCLCSRAVTEAKLHFSSIRTCMSCVLVLVLIPSY
jgi:hypothetical protein